MRFTISFFLLFLITAISNAQVFNTGIIGGISAAQVEGDGYGGFDKFGFILGGFTNTDFNKKWSAQFEVYYINKGSVKNAQPDKGDYESFYLNINYIEIPLSLRYRHKKFMFETGTYLAYMLNYKIEDEFGEVTISDYPFKKIDIGAFVGFNYQINQHFSFNLRSKTSVLPIREFLNYDQRIGIINKLFERGWYNLDLNFSIRYQFNFNKNEQS